jgi:hypothetical protein
MGANIYLRQLDKAMHVEKSKAGFQGAPSSLHDGTVLQAEPRTTSSEVRAHQEH